MKEWVQPNIILSIFWDAEETYKWIVLDRPNDIIIKAGEGRVTGRKAERRHKLYDWLKRRTEDAIMFVTYQSELNAKQIPYWERPKEYFAEERNKFFSYMSIEESISGFYLTDKAKEIQEFFNPNVFDNTEEYMEHYWEYGAAKMCYDLFYFSLFRPVVDEEESLKERTKKVFMYLGGHQLNQ